MEEMEVPGSKVGCICPESSFCKYGFRKCFQCPINQAAKGVAFLVKSEPDVKIEDIGCPHYKETKLKSEKIEPNSIICANYVCQDCSAIFTSEELFTDHIRKNHIQKPCPDIRSLSFPLQCDMNSDSVYSLNAVQMLPCNLKKESSSNRDGNMTISDVETKSENSKNWNCPQCNKQYNSEAEFLTHTKQHWLQSLVNKNIKLPQLFMVSSNSTNNSIDDSHHFFQSNSQNNDICMNKRFNKVYKFRRKKPIYAANDNALKTDDMKSLDKSIVNCAGSMETNQEHEMIQGGHRNDKLGNTSTMSASLCTSYCEENDNTVFASDDLIISDEKARSNKLKEERKKKQQIRKTVKSSSNEERKKKPKITQNKKSKQKQIDVACPDMNVGNNCNDKVESSPNDMPGESIQNEGLTGLNTDHCSQNIEMSITKVAKCNTIVNEKGTHENSQEFPCTVCPCLLKNQSLFESHMVLHEETLYHCQVCNYFYKTEENLGKHMKKEHNEYQKLYVCRLCSYTICGPKSAMKDHYINDCPSKNNKFACDFCTFKCETQETIEKHMVACERSNNRKIFKPYQCKECDFRAENGSSMRRHTIRVHFPFREKKFKCDLCPYKADREDSWKRHHLQHTRRAQKLIVNLNQINS